MRLMTTPIWARPAVPSATKWCAVAGIQGGSVLTHCNGRWSVDDQCDVSHDPPHEERCEACVRSCIEERRKEIGLAELRDAEPTRATGGLTWSPSGEFDTSDFGGEG